MNCRYLSQLGALRHGHPPRAPQVVKGSSEPLELGHLKLVSNQRLSGAPHCLILCVVPSVLLVVSEIFFMTQINDI